MRRGSGPTRFTAIDLFSPRRLALIAAAALSADIAGCKPAPAPPPATAPATRPATATAPATTQAATKPADPTYFDVVRAAHPTFAATRSLAAPVELREAAHFVLTDPVYLDEQGHLWITRPDAPPADAAAKAWAAAAVGKKGAEPVGDEHVVRDRVRFVWWVVDYDGLFLPAAVVDVTAPGDAARPAAGRSSAAAASGPSADPASTVVVPTTAAASTAAAPAAAATQSMAGRLDLVLPTRRVPVGQRSDYAWHRARTWTVGREQRLVVPTTHGVSVFTFGSSRSAVPVTEAHQDLLGLADARPATGPAAATNPANQDAAAETAAAAAPVPTSPPGTEPQFAFDPRGMIAWLPAAGPTEADPAGRPGGPGAARFVDGKWTPLPPAAGWPDRLLHLIPLRDGSVTQLVLKTPAESAEGPPGGVRIGMAAVDAPPVDRKAIEKLVDELSAEDRAARDAAYRQLAQYGPGAWPVLRDVPLDDVSPETRARLRQLLRSQVTPMLGGLALQGDQLRLVARLRDGGAVFYTDQGVFLPSPQGDDDPIGQAPAWVAARPGRPVELLSGLLVNDAVPGRTRFDVVGDQWVLTTDADGPKQFLGNSFRKLLRKADAEYTTVVGLDRHGRWLFRKPADVAAAAAAGPAGLVPPTLVVDPMLADFTPRLPAWTYADANEVGWDKDGWPAVRLETLRMRLAEDRWVPLAEGDTLLTDPPPRPPAAPPSSEPQVAPPNAAPATASAAATEPATGPTTRPATAPAATSRSAAPGPAATRPTGPSAERLAALGPPLLVDPAGARYYDGVEALLAIRPDGTEDRWPLPAAAVGKPPVTLLRAAGGHLFLFNQPGRVLRINPTPAGPAPFALEATFARDIPSDEPRRAWVDPAGRVVLAFDKRLVFLFPDGFIPRPIRQLMAATPDDEDE